MKITKQGDDIYVQWKVKHESLVRINTLIEKNVDYTEQLEEVALKELKYLKYNCLKMIGKENGKNIYVITNDHTNVLPICAETNDD